MSNPGVPAGPVAPVAPLGPVAPVAPLGPVAPVAPLGLVAPVAPLGPVAPVAPRGPIGPVAPAPLPPILITSFPLPPKLTPPLGCTALTGTRYGTRRNTTAFLNIGLTNPPPPMPKLLNICVSFYFVIHLSFNL